jgi:hypothetical protein
MLRGTYIVYEKQRFFGGFVVASGGQGDTVVVVEVVVVVPKHAWQVSEGRKGSYWPADMDSSHIHVCFDGVEIYIDVLELLHEEVTRGHTLPTWWDGTGT